MHAYFDKILSKDHFGFRQGYSSQQRLMVLNREMEKKFR